MGHTLQVQVAAAVTERQQLIEAFTFERAKREAEALTVRRGLEEQLEGMVGHVFPRNRVLCTCGLSRFDWFMVRASS